MTPAALRRADGATCDGCDCRAWAFCTRCGHCAHCCSGTACSDDAPAQPAALDLDAIEARVRGLITTCWHDITVPGGGCSRVATHECQRECCNNPLCEEHAAEHNEPSHPVVKRPDDAVADALALLARVRELEADIAARDRSAAETRAWLDEALGVDEPEAGPATEVAALRRANADLRARLRSQEHAVALDAIRRGPPSTWVRCLACGGTRADVDGAPCEPCRGTGQHPPPAAESATPNDLAGLFAAFDRMGVPMPGDRYVGNLSGARYEVVAAMPVDRRVRMLGADGEEFVVTFDLLARNFSREGDPPPVARDRCPTCGALDLDHAPEECARRWAEQNPEAAAGIVGCLTAPRVSPVRSEECD